MKKILFLFTLLSLLTTLVNAQKIGQAPGVIQIDTIGAPLRVVSSTSGTGSSAIQDTSKRITAWMESGLGQFTTSPGTWYQVPSSSLISSTPPTYHPPFLFATNLYDTTKGLAKPSRLVSNTSSPSMTSTKTFPKILSGSNIKITPNTPDLVPGDTMVFAVTYNINKGDTGTGQSRTNKLSADKVFRLYFFYNIDNTFIPVTSEDQPNIMSVGLPMKNCRSHNGESAISFNLPPATTGINAYNHQNCISYTLPSDNANTERSVFFTMLPINDSLKIGTSGSVYAVLTQNDSIIDTDLIQNMLFRPAHDPNYLIQKPGCINLPKKEYPFEYTVHFQNTGAGRATEVKAVVHLPNGMNWSTLSIKKATFAGTDYTNRVIVSANPLNNELTVIFKYDAVLRTNYLLGTDDSQQPAIDPQTMGEFLFTINSTRVCDDTLKSNADIYFRSEFPSDLVDAQGYEFPVQTNTGVTTYKDCCNGNDCPPSPCCKILGLAWWWWIIILLLLNIVIWYIIRKRRRHRKC